MCHCYCLHSDVWWPSFAGTHPYGRLCTGLRLHARHGLPGEGPEDGLWEKYSHLSSTFVMVDDEKKRGRKTILVSNDVAQMACVYIMMAFADCSPSRNGECNSTSVICITRWLNVLFRDWRNHFLNHFSRGWRASNNHWRIKLTSFEALILL